MMKRIKILYPTAKGLREADLWWSEIGRQVKIDCQCLPVPFSYTGNSIYHRRSATVSGRQVSGIAGGLRTILGCVSRLVEKKNLAVLKCVYN